MTARCSVAAILCAVALLSACGGAGDRPPAVPPAMTDLVETLREGGHVIFLRHAATDTTIPSGGDDHRDDCARQRNLTGDGRHDAAALGARLDALGVPIGEAYASPYCRTLDTARLAVGDVRTDERLLPLPGARTRLGPLLTPPPVGSPNRLLVGHASTMADLLDVHLDEGEAAVLTVDGQGRPQLVGRLSTSALAITPSGG